MNDPELFPRLIACIAGGKGENGMRAVADFVMNRVNIPYSEYALYPTISEAVFQEYRLYAR